MPKMTDQEFKEKTEKLLSEQKETEKEDAKKADPVEVEKGRILNLATETLTGDIRDFLLDRVKRLGKPWAAMSEDEQSDQIHAAKEAAQLLVKRACEIIASSGKRAVIGKLVKVAIKDKIQVQVDFSREDEQRHELFDAQGHTVSIVFADSQPYTGERGPAEPTPNQGDMLADAEKLKKGDEKVETLKPKK